MMRHGTAIAILFGVIAACACSPAADAATNTELVPGSRIVFPYYDLRPGFATLLFLTNTGSTPASAALEFYDATCARQDTVMGLSTGDIDPLDLSQVISGTAFGSFLQGFIDVAAGADVLIGTALVVNMVDDWAIAYNGATARRQTGGVTPFEPYPTGLFLPAFLTSGQLGGGVLADGLLIVAAPHPTVPGGELPDSPLQDKPIQASVEVFLQQEDGTMTQRSSALNGHYIISPIGAIAGALSPTLGWLSIRNHASDESGNPFGLVGLYIQTLVGPNSGSAMAIRLSGDPSAASTPPGP
ncbi:MAG: hypothetical protein C3F12_05570 [Candidatus Methylomirabilota bacterium]|nr:MAG: hypothetical protein C3F12_05570 [candidate division NC10 bacterium]